MPPARKTPARRPAGARASDVTKALDALNDAITRAQTAAKAVRADVGRSSLRADLARDVERLIRDLRRDAGKLDRAVRSDLRKVVGPKKPAGATAKKTTAKKTTAKKAGTRTAAKKRS